jgi:hypothetical protein
MLFIAGEIEDTTFSVFQIVFSARIIMFNVSFNMPDKYRIPGFRATD